MFDMKLEFNKGILFVRLYGDLKRDNTIKINNYLLNLIISNKIKYLVYNMYYLTSIDVPGIDALLNTKYAINELGGSIYICEIPAYLSKVVKRLNINTTIDELSAIDAIKI